MRDVKIVTYDELDEGTMAKARQVIQKSLEDALKPLNWYSKACNRCMDELKDIGIDCEGINFSISKKFIKLINPQFTLTYDSSGKKSRSIFNSVVRERIEEEFGKINDTILDQILKVVIIDETPDPDRHSYHLARSSAVTVFQPRTDVPVVYGNYVDSIDQLVGNSIETCYIILKDILDRFTDQFILLSNCEFFENGELYLNECDKMRL